MLDIKFIQENKDIVAQTIKNKKGEDIDLDHLMTLYDKRKELLGAIDEKRATQNEVSKKVAQAASEQEKNQLVSEMQKLKDTLKKEEEELKEVMKEFIGLMSQIPNIPTIDTPVGEDENDNVVVRQWGDKPKFDFTPKPHWELGESLDIIDKERAAKVSGARFAYIKKELALMQFALVQLTFETLTSTETLEKIARNADLDVNVNEFIPIVPPVIIKPEMLNAMGRLYPTEDRYHLDQDDMYLIGSAEHTIGPMYAEEILDEETLPLRYVGYSTSFRREAGSYGKDTRGILRMHQFDKLEMETFCLADDSFKEQEFLVAIQEYLTQQLKLPYQVVLICTGDMGAPDQRQFDIETWMPGQDTYRETHSADLIGAYQPRRLNTRVRRKDGKTEFVHMNDATAFAIGRTLIAIMENNQQKDGSITIPEALRPYMQNRDAIKAS